MIKSILIANRGEIACRIIRTARQLGIKTVAIYSEADKRALHVRQADKAFCVGSAPAAESYLNISRIIDVALEAGVDAIHPGYVFLAENAGFVKTCQKKNLIFIGPSAEVMKLMGSKQAAKAHLEPLGIPVVPGYHGKDQKPEKLLQEAQKIGFPLLIKASAGGGGRGMRIVEHERDFPQALTAAKKESLRNFADDKVILERYIRHPKHIEIQVFADKAGNCIHLGERECSVQRRHQKLIEETPSAFLTPKQREMMGMTAVKIAQVIKYAGAGTVEFIVDTDQSSLMYYFMEMNTRLQVEHPVTEMVTGFDLVAWQLRIASGENLPVKQSEIGWQGSAIEARLYAEDSAKDFAPSTGVIKSLSLPTNPDVRCDIGYEQGDIISPYYDSMMMKVIAHAPTREEAIKKLHESLYHLFVQGVVTNNSFLRRILNHSDFLAGVHTTTWVEQHLNQFLASKESFDFPAALAALFVVYQRIQKDIQGPWCYDGWTMAAGAIQKVDLKIQDQVFSCQVCWHEELSQVIVHQTKFCLSLAPQHDPIWLVRNNGSEQAILAACDEDKVTLQIEDGTFIFSVDQPELHEHDWDSSEHSLKAPMPGQITAVYVQTGMAIKKGMILLTMEAMKMEHKIIAPKDGVVESLYCQVGDQVTEGMNLLHFDWQSEEKTVHNV